MRAAAMLAGILLVVQAAPALAALPYERVVRNQPLKLPVASAADPAAKLMPAAWSSEVFEAQYSEYQVTPALRYGFITCRSLQPGYISVLYYAGDAATYVVLKQLPLHPNQLCTYTCELPPKDSAGLSRLLVWQQSGATKSLALLAGEAYPPDLALPDLAAERWFERAESAAVRMPWMSPFRAVSMPPRDFITSQWPMYYAELESDYTARCKDCSVEFNGSMNIGYDSLGSYGRWLLDWGATLTLSFELPVGRRLSEATLLVYGTPDGALQFSAPPELVPEINGWRLAAVDYSLLYATPVQPLPVDVSHYLQPGMNQIELQLDTFSDAQLYVEKLELWAR